MEISARNDFAAAPDQVAAMLTDREFLTQVAEATEARTVEVRVHGGHTRTERTFDTPAAAAKIAGPTITVVDEVTWAEPEANGSRHGTIELSTPGLPAAMHGTAQLAPGDKGTVVTYSGTFTVSIPFVGKKLETQAAPLITSALDVQQRVGDDWLARH